MTTTQSLQSLESLLVSFLDRVVQLKEHRLNILEGLNGLDEITSQTGEGLNITDEIGDWFANHNKWLTEKSLKPADIDRISSMLTEIKSKIKTQNRITPAENKIFSEIDRWDQKLKPAPKKLKLIRKSETSYVQPKPDLDTISLFVSKLSKLTALFMDYSGNKQHLLSALDDLLNSAIKQTRLLA